MRRRTTKGTVLGSVLAAALLAGCGLSTVHAATHPAPSARTPTPATGSPTPRASPRASTTSPAGPLRVVGLGDSVTSGEHCDCDDYVTGFGHLLADQDGVQVKVTDDGESGSTSDTLASELRTDDGLRSDVAHADLVVVTMGANDLAPALGSWRSGSCPTSCYDPLVQTMGQDLGQVLDSVQTLGGGRTQVLVTTYWNVFTDGDVARNAERSGYLTWSDTVTRRANATIAQTAAARGATLVDLYTPFKGDGSKDPTHLLAPDGDHPDDAGTALISRTVLATLEAER